VNPEAITGLIGFIAQCQMTPETVGAIFMCPDPLHHVLLASVIKLYHLHGQMKIETILGEVLNNYQQKEQSVGSNSPFHVCFGNMRKFKTYWNADNDLQHSFPQGRLSLSQEY